MAKIPTILTRKEVANFSKIGDVVSSMLSEAEFQAERDATWILMDGRDVIGSDYAILKTGDAVTSHNIPDARGQFLRGKDHGRHLIDGEGNPDGDLDLGTQTGDGIRNITGTFRGRSDDSGHFESAGGAFALAYAGIRNNSGNESGVAYQGADFDASTVVPTADDNRPKNITVNHFIKIYH